MFRIRLNHRSPIQYSDQTFTYTKLPIDVVHRVKRTIEMRLLHLGADGSCKLDPAAPASLATFRPA